MANDRLRAALGRAALTNEHVARQVGVDPKTVQKWLAGRVPHPRHRWAVSQLVDEQEEFLWPNARRNAADRAGDIAEIVAAYPRRASVDALKWRRLIDQGKQQIDLLGYTAYFLPQLVPEFVDILLEKCEAGCQIRLVIADPHCEQVRLRDDEEQEPITIVARIETSLRAYEPLLACGNAELRFQAAPLYNSVFRFDEEMFVTPHLYATPGHSAPLLHLRRVGPNGLFARFASHFDGIWADTTPMTQTRGRKSAPAAG